jgi:hypothetical protein
MPNVTYGSSSRAISIRAWRRWGKARDAMAGQRDSMAKRLTKDFPMAIGDKGCVLTVFEKAVPENSLSK